MISQNVKDAVETAIMNIIEDVVTNDIEEEERQKKRVRQETPNLGQYLGTHVTGPYSCRF